MWRLTLSKATRVKPLRGLTSALQDSGKLTVLHNIELHVLYRYCNRRQAYMEDAYIEGMLGINLIFTAVIPWCVAKRFANKVVNSELSTSMV